MDASNAPIIARGHQEWERFLSFKRGFVRLTPDVREAFPDEESVNKALRKVMELQDLKTAVKRRKSA